MAPQHGCFGFKPYGLPSSSAMCAAGICVCVCACACACARARARACVAGRAPSPCVVARAASVAEPKRRSAGNTTPSLTAGSSEPIAPKLTPGASSSTTTPAPRAAHARVGCLAARPLVPRVSPQYPSLYAQPQGRLLRGGWEGREEEVASGGCYSVATHPQPRHHCAVAYVAKARAGPLAAAWSAPTRCHRHPCRRAWCLRPRGAARAFCPSLGR